MIYSFFILNNINTARRIGLTLHLHTSDDALLTRLQQTQASVLPQLTFAVVVVDPNGDAQATGFGARAPGGGLDQTVLLPG